MTEKQKRDDLEDVVTRIKKVSVTNQIERTVHDSYHRPAYAISQLTGRRGRRECDLGRDGVAQSRSEVIGHRSIAQHAIQVLNQTSLAGRDILFLREIE